MALASPRQVTLLVNPSAGHGKGHLIAPRLAQRLMAGMPGTRVKIQLTTSPRDAQESAFQIAHQNHPVSPGQRPDVLAVVGGDGSASIGLNACAGTSTQLAIIPAGTGDDFRRGIGAPGSATKAVDAIIRGDYRRIDLLEARGELSDGTQSRYVGSVVSTGYDARVNRRVNHATFDAGRLSYVWAVIAEAINFHPLRYQISCDDGPVRELEALVVAVGNAGYIGGGIHICPQADPGDGMLDVTIVHPVPIRTLARNFRSLYNGRFTRLEQVETLRCRTIRVDGVGLHGMADGEELGPTPLELSCAPQCLDVIV